ncbi:MAG: hypothetical protein ACYDCN_09390 [Bacteroidia bacterium]
MTIITLPAIQVKKLTKNATTTAVIKAGLLIHIDGDADVVSPTGINDAAIHGAANTLQTMETGSKQSPPTYTTGQVKGQKHIVITMYNKIVANVQTGAIDVAIAHGDNSFGNTVVTRCGCKLSKAKGGGKHPDFGVVATGLGWMQVHFTRVKKRGIEGHLWRVAYVSGDGVIPAKDTIIYFSTLESDIIIKDVIKGRMVAIDHASALTGGHSKKPTGNMPNTQRKAAILAVSKGNHPTMSILADPHTWKGWIFEAGK